MGIIGDILSGVSIIAGLASIAFGLFQLFFQGIGQDTALVQISYVKAAFFVVLGIAAFAFAALVILADYVSWRHSLEKAKAA